MSKPIDIQKSKANKIERKKEATLQAEVKVFALFVQRWTEKDVELQTEHFSSLFSIEESSKPKIATEKCKKLKNVWNKYSKNEFLRATSIFRRIFWSNRSKIESNRFSRKNLFEQRKKCSIWKKRTFRWRFLVEKNRRSTGRTEKSFEKYKKVSTRRKVLIERRRAWKTK